MTAIIGPKDQKFGSTPDDLKGKVVGVQVSTVHAVYAKKHFGATASEIKEFCTKNYGVTFPMADKVDVIGDKIDPLFKYLTAEANKLGVTDPVIKWNFTKFLIDENGKLIAVFPSKVKPMDDQITKYLN